ncbi:hypothetical protein QTP70_005210, partial [Hemibagrus guttatus]
MRHWWLSGRVLAYHAKGQGSIPANASTPATGCSAGPKPGKNGRVAAGRASGVKPVPCCCADQLVRCGDPEQGTAESNLQMNTRYRILPPVKPARPGVNATEGAEKRRGECKLLGDKLTCGEEADVDGSALATEMESLPELPEEKMTAFELLTYLSQNEI